MTSERQQIVIRLALSFLCLVALLPAVVMAFMSPMMFDAPGSDERASTWIGFASTLSVPLCLIAAIVTMNWTKKLRYFWLAFAWLGLVLASAAVHTAGY